jgi:hypothetical protein
MRGPRFDNHWRRALIVGSFWHHPSGSPQWVWRNSWLCLERLSLRRGSASPNPKGLSAIFVGPVEQAVQPGRLHTEHTHGKSCHRSSNPRAWRWAGESSRPCCDQQCWALSGTAETACGGAGSGETVQTLGFQVHPRHLEAGIATRRVRQRTKNNIGMPGHVRLLRSQGEFEGHVRPSACCVRALLRWLRR